MWMLYDTSNATTGREHFGGPQYALSKLGLDSDSTVYTGLIALLVNIAVSVLDTLVARRFKRPEGLDSTEPDDYVADAADARFKRMPAEPRETVAARD